MNRFGKIMRFLKNLLLILILIGLIIGVFIEIKLFNKIAIPINKAYSKSQEIAKEMDYDSFKMLENTKIYDDNGDIIYEVKRNNYKYVEHKDISEWVKLAYIGVEDKDFLEHNGVDYRGILRAIIINAKESLKQGKLTVKQGGSTIHMQIVKNNFLNQKQEISRKLIEFFVAQEIDNKFSKDEIMEFYVNSNYYANNNYGIQAASKFYFNKDAKNLELHEAALLAGISNLPSKYDPVNNPENALEKRNFVLKHMYDEKLIDKNKYEDAINKDLGLNINRVEAQLENGLINYIIEESAKEILVKKGFEFKYIFNTKEEQVKYEKLLSEEISETINNIKAGGYKISTSINKEKQSMVLEKMNKGLSKFQDVDSRTGKLSMQGAAVLINNETGYIEAMVGARDENDQVNRANRFRLPGSTIKPFVVYGPAYDSGEYHPSKILKDEVPKDLKPKEFFPKNSNNRYLGEVTMREALARSINTIPFKLTMDLTPLYGLEYLAKMNFYIPYTDNFNSSVALGGFEKGVKPLDMANAISTIVNKGQFRNLGAVVRIEHEKHGIIYNSEDKEPIKVFEEDTAYLLIDNMRDVMSKGYGTGKRLNIDNLDLIGKTGTTNNQYDTWFIGATPYYSLSIWNGHDYSKNTNMYGSTLSGPIWKDIMEDLHNNAVIDKNKVFEKPETIFEGNYDNKGNLTKNKTGKKDLFSKFLINKAKEEREALARKKKLKEQKEFSKKIEDKIRELSYLNMNNKSDALIMNEKIEFINQDLQKLDSRLEASKLKGYLELVIDEHEPDYSLFKEQLIQDEIIRKEAEEQELYNDINSNIVNLNNFTPSEIIHIDEVKSNIYNIKLRINSLSDTMAKQDLTNKLMQVESIKLKELEPLIEERERIREYERQMEEERLRQEEEEKRKDEELKQQIIDDIMNDITIDDNNQEEPNINIEVIDELEPIDNVNDLKLGN